MRCPNCSTEIPAQAWECPSCQLIVAKIIERREREKKAAEALLTATPPAPAPIALWKVRAAAIAVVIAWLVGLSIYIRSSIKPPTKASREDAAEEVFIRDPATGELKRVLMPKPAGPAGN